MTPVQTTPAFFYLGNPVAQPLAPAQTDPTFIHTGNQAVPYHALIETTPAAQNMAPSPYGHTQGGTPVPRIPSSIPDQNNPAQFKMNSAPQFPLLRTPTHPADQTKLQTIPAQVYSAIPTTQSSIQSAASHMNWHPTNQPTYTVEHPSVHSLNSSHFRENSDGYTRPIKSFQEIAQHLAQQELTPEQQGLLQLVLLSKLGTSQS
eukprot:sb/3470539/